MHANMNVIMVWHGCSGHRMQSNMNVTMVWAWMLWSPDAVEHERYYGLGRGCSVPFGHGCSGHRMHANMNVIMVWHGCSGHRMQSNMNVTMVWAWMLWSPDAVEHERYYGLGRGCSVPFGHGCSGHWTQTNMNVIMVWA